MSPSLPRSGPSALLILGWISIMGGPARATTLVYEKNCTSDQRSSMKEAFSTILPIVKQGAGAIDKMTSEKPTALYTTWFGNPNGGRFSTARATIDGLQDLLQDKSTFTVECLPPRCTPGEYARTTYRQDYIALCDMFFKAPLRGENSRSGTLLHELTHVVADTVDEAYGRDSCKRLATGNPNVAVKNADNFEYFLEDVSAK